MMLTVTKLAKSCNLARSTVLYYESIGLLRPPRRSDGNYRVYASQDLDRLRRTRLVDGLAALVEHGADAAEGVARDDRVSGAERSALDEHGRDRAAAAVEVSLDGDALRVLAGVRPQVERCVRGEEHGLEEIVDAGAGASGAPARTRPPPRRTRRGAAGRGR